MPEYTKTERKILVVLADGRRHLKEELFSVLNGDANSRSAVAVHVTNIRRKLNPLGEDIICEYHSRRIHYRHVRLISVK